MPKESLHTQNQKLRDQNELLQARLADAEETLRAIRHGEVDALVVDGASGSQVFTLQSADKPHRLLVEAMSEGAMTLTSDGIVMYCNTRLAEMVNRPLEQIIGSPWQRLFPVREQPAFQEIIASATQNKAGRSRGESALRQGDEGLLPVTVSVSSADLDGVPAIAVLLTDISRRKAAEQALRQANESLEFRVEERTGELRRQKEFLENLIANAPIGVAVIDKQWRYVVANATYQAIPGTPGVKIIGKTVGEVFPPNVAEAIRGHVEKVFESASPLHLREYELKIGGKRTWWNVSEVPLRGSTGEMEAVLVLTEEITERKKAEEHLRESEQRFRSLFENSPDAVFLTMPDGRIARANPAACAMFGMTEEEICQKGRAGLVDSADPRHTALLEERQRTGRFTNKEASYVRKDGTKFPGEVSSVMLPGEPPSAFVILRDISKRKEAEAALRESEYRFRIMGETIDYGVWMCNKDAELEYVSQSLLDLLNMSMAQAKEFGWTKRLVPEDVAGMMEKWMDCVRTGKVWDSEHRIIDRHGQIHTILTRGKPVRDAQGNITSWVGINLDITERKKTEQALAEAKEQLRQHAENLERTVHERTEKLNEMVQELEHFSYTITHDMRAPLRAMHGISKMLMNECAECPNAERRDLLRRIADASTRMDSLITDALNYNRAVREELELEPVDAKELLLGMLETYPEFHPHRADIRVDGEFPMVLGNKAGLMQCFSNLLSNAIKFVEPGKVPQIHVWSETHDDWVRLNFKDNGLGIPKQYQEQIWDMFQKLSKEYEGTGIGLALVRKVMDRMGGKAGLESESGKGSRFWLDLKRVS